MNQLGPTAVFQVKDNQVVANTDIKSGGGGGGGWGAHQPVWMSL